MTFEEYVGRYSSLKGIILHFQEQKNLMESDPYLHFLNDVDAAGAADDLPNGVFLPSDMDRRLHRAWRLYRKYLIRLARACDLVRGLSVRDLAIKHYLYGLTHEEIAERGHYGVRTVYRQSREARRQIREYLLLMMPCVKRIPPQKFRLTESGRQTVRARCLQMEWRRRAPKRKGYQHSFTVRPERAFFGKTMPDA